MQLPTHQNAAVKKGEGSSAKCQVTTIPVPHPGPGQILCKINYSGICGTDRGFFYDEFAARGTKMHESAKGISGHEGAGVVIAVADNVKELWKEGDRVGIKWVASVCGKCEFCTNGTNELQCPLQLNSGLTVPGTFQEYCLTDARYATRLPDGVKDEEAGPIMCGGVTAYTACRRSQVRAGQWIVLMGAGGGLGHMALQYARVMGMRVIAVDGGADKEKLCLSLGAEHFIDYTSVQDIPAEVLRITKYGAHGVAVFATSSQSYVIAPFLLRPGGTVVAVGIPSDPNVMAGAPPGILATRSLNVVGAVTGTLKQVDEALDFVARGLVKPNLIHCTLHDIDEMFDRMGAGQLAGRAVIKVSG